MQYSKEVHNDAAGVDAQLGAGIKMEKTVQMNHELHTICHKVLQQYAGRSMTYDAVFNEVWKNWSSYGKHCSEELFGAFMDAYPMYCSGKGLPGVSHTPLGSLLGRPTPYIGGVQGKFVVPEKDQKCFDEIKKLARSTTTTRMLNDAARIVAYNGPDNLSGKGGPNNTNDISRLSMAMNGGVVNHVHPVVAAFFGPQVKLFDERMLHSDLAALLTRLERGETRMTAADYSFFRDLTMDPNVNVCDDTSEVRDLLRRSMIQSDLRDIVMNFRSGNAFQRTCMHFMSHLNSCKSSKDRGHHINFTTDEGVVMKRLMNIFALRPTALTDENVAYDNGPAAIGYPFRPIHRVPFIEVRLPPPGVYTQGVAPVADIGLLDALNAPVQTTDGRFVYKQSKNIIFNQEVLVFYVPRRFKSIQVQQNQMMNPFNPPPMVDLDMCNQQCVKFEDTLTLNGRTAGAYNKVEFELKSVVCVKTADGNSFGPGYDKDSKIINGAQTYMKKTGGGWVCYDPMAMFGADGKNGKVFGECVDGQVRDCVQTCGSIYVYVKKTAAVVPVATVVKGADVCKPAMNMQEIVVFYENVKDDPDEQKGEDDEVNDNDTFTKTKNEISKAFSGDAIERMCDDAFKERLGSIYDDWKARVQTQVVNIAGNPFDAASVDVNKKVIRQVRQFAEIVKADVALMKNVLKGSSEHAGHPAKIGRMMTALNDMLPHTVRFSQARSDINAGADLKNRITAATAIKAIIAP